MNTRLRKSHLLGPFVLLSICALGLSVLSPSARAGTYSFEGTLGVSESQEIDFNVFGAAPSGVSFRAFHNSGGTNAAGNVIASGGHDSIVFLLDSTGTPIAFDDNGAGSGLDPFLRQGVGDNPIPSPLPAGSYTALFSQLAGTGGDHWALDFVNSNNNELFDGLVVDGVNLAKVTATGDQASLSSVSVGAGELQISATETFLSGHSVVQTAAARMIVTNGSDLRLQDDSTITVRPGGQMEVGGRSAFGVNSLLSFNENTGVFVDSGSLVVRDNGLGRLAFGSDLVVTGASGLIELHESRLKIEHDGSSLSVLAGGRLTTDDMIEMGNAFTPQSTEFNVNGSGSTAVIGAESKILSGGQVVVSDSGFALFDAGLTLDGTSPALRIDTGGTVRVDDALNVSGPASVVAVTGAGSALRQNAEPVDNLTPDVTTIGRASASGPDPAGAAAVFIESGGTFHGGDEIRVYKDGFLAVNDGILNLNGPLNILGGQAAVKDLGLNTNGHAVNVSDGGNLTTVGFSVLDGGSTYTVTGGSIEMVNVQIGTQITDGTVVLQGPTSSLRQTGTGFNRIGSPMNGTGSLRLQGGAMFSASGEVVIDNTGSVSVESGSFFFGGTAGTTIEGTLRVDAGSSFGGTYSIRDGGLFTHETFGSLNLNDGNLAGGTLAVPNGRVVVNSAVTQAHGEIQGDFFGFNGSSLSLTTGDLTVGDATSPNGFEMLGALDVGVHTLTIHDQNEALLFGDVTIGTGGEIIADNGLRLGPGSTLNTAGSVSTPNGKFVVEGQVVAAAGTQVVFNDDVEGTTNFTGDIVFNGNVRPGTSPGLMQFGDNATLAESSTLFIELAGLDPVTEYDQFLVAGDLSLFGTLNVETIGGFMLDLGQEFDIIDVGGTRTGQFQGVAEGQQLLVQGDVALFISYQGGDGNDIFLFTGHTVPEPASIAIWCLVGLALTSFGYYRVRYHKQRLA